MYQTRIYNGVNHDIKLFENPTKFTVNRKGQYFLNDPDAQPDKIIRQMKPLSVRSNPVQASFSAASLLFLPEAVGAQIETLPNFSDFDIIVVSTIYAGMARQLILNNPEYLDRLYTPVAVYDDDPQSFRNSVRMAGSIGFKKVWYPRTPQEYVMEFRAGRLPSLASVSICLDIYNTQRAYCDANTTAWLTELRNWLPRETFNSGM